MLTHAASYTAGFMQNMSRRDGERDEEEEVYLKIFKGKVTHFD